VISLGEFAHKVRGKFAWQKSVVGTGATAFQRIAGDDEYAAVFLWTTFEDKTVPMENTLLFAERCGKITFLCAARL